MIAQLKGRLAASLISGAQEGIAKLDKDSPLAKEIRNLDVDRILEADIRQICDEISFPEVATVMSLIARIKLGGSDTEHLKEGIKKIAKSVVKRIEEKKGKLQTPQSCRELLFNL